MIVGHPEPLVVRTLSRRWRNLSDDVTWMIINFRIRHPTTQLRQQLSFERGHRWHEDPQLRITGASFLVLNLAGQMKARNSMAIADWCYGDLREESSLWRSGITVGQVITAEDLEERRLRDQLRRGHIE